MGNCLSCFNKPREEPPVPGLAPTVEKVEETSVSPTLEEVIDSLKGLSDTADLGEFIRIIKKLLEEKKSDKASTNENAKENKGMWTSFVTSGAKFLKFVNSHTEKIEDKKDIFYSGNSKVAAEIIGQIGQLHWAVGGLAIIAYLIEKFEKVSANKAEALELLSKMVDLATTVTELRDVIPEEEDKLKKAVMLVVQGSIMCVSQIYSLNIFSFLKTSVNSENLKEMSNTLDHLYKDLTLAISTAIANRQLEMAERQSEMAKRQSEMAERQSEMAKHQSIVLPVSKPLYPKDAVGIENAREEVTKLLNMTTEDYDEPLVVVIYGFGGIGKTTLATCVAAMLNLDGYNYTRVQLDEDMSKNSLKKMQELILKDAFPSYHSEGTIKFRDCQDGRDHLRKAFLCAGNKPVFLFIDNALKSEDLKELLPEDLSDMPKRSRILLTTRQLDETDVFLSSGLKRHPFAMKTLEKDYAVEILCKDPNNRERIKDDMERILRICGGVPLALKIVGGHLSKMGYSARKCSQILDALEKGGHVKEENLSQRLIHYVYNELEDGTKDAFLDICCFFNGWILRRVEYIVGAQEVKSLEEAAFITPFLDDGDRTLIYAGEERLIVHDIIKAIGQTMSASTRFMDVQSFSEAAQDRRKLSEIKGLWFPEEEEYVLDVEHLNSMKHSLRIMRLGPNKRTSAQSSMKFKELRYLHVWWHIPQLPMKVEELDSLGAYLGPIGTNGISMNKWPKSLWRIGASQTVTLVESSSAQGIQNHSLEELQLNGGKMKQLPEGLDQLCSLKFLVLLQFVNIEEFPEQICKLSSLIKLSIIGWSKLKHLPQLLGQLKRLTHLQIRSCSQLEELPSSLGELIALERLIIWNCPKLKQLPGDLESLKYLLVRDCKCLNVESYQSQSGLRIDVW